MKKYQQSLYVKKPNKRSAQYQISKYDLIKKHHKFIRDSDSQQSCSQQKQSNTDNKMKNQQNQKQQSKKTLNLKKLNKQELQKKGQKLAKQYYESLYKQYAVVDLSRFESGQIGCRWRTQKQVIKNKGQRLCGALKCNQQSTNVYQMNFGYLQNGQKKNALVKVSTCKQCGIKLNYCKKLKQVQKKPKLQELD